MEEGRAGHTLLSLLRSLRSMPCAHEDTLPFRRRSRASGRRQSEVCQASPKKGEVVTPFLKVSSKEPCVIPSGLPGPRLSH